MYIEGAVIEFKFLKICLHNALNGKKVTILKIFLALNLKKKPALKLHLPHLTAIL